MASTSNGTTADDRQRDRQARGIGARAGLAVSDRPSPPRRRRPALMALAVVLIVGGAAMSGLLAVRLDTREPHLVLTRDVPVGTQITADLFETAQVSGGTLLVPEAQIDEVLGTFARVPLNEGQLLDTTMLTTAEPFGPDVALVGVPLIDGKVPTGLRSGDEVRIVRTSESGRVAEPLAVGLVVSVGSSDDEGGFTGGGAVATATVVVPVGAADAVVDAAGGDAIGMSLVRRGVAIDDADLDVLSGGGA